MSSLAPIVVLEQVVLVLAVPEARNDDDLLKEAGLGITQKSTETFRNSYLYPSFR